LMFRSALSVWPIAAICNIPLENPVSPEKTPTAAAARK
jgi:hypothetical protein